MSLSVFACEDGVITSCSRGQKLAGDFDECGENSGKMMALNHPPSSMKYYPPVLVVLRFCAVGIASLALYYIVMSWVAFGAGSANDDYAKLMQRGKEASLNHGLSILGIGFGLYVTSPLLARLITWGSDVGSGRCPRD